MHNSPPNLCLAKRGEQSGGVGQRAQLSSAYRALDLCRLANPIRTLGTHSYKCGVFLLYDAEHSRTLVEKGEVRREYSGSTHTALAIHRLGRLS